MATRSPEKICTRDDLYYRKLVDGGMVYDEKTGSVHHLNLTAARIWESCQLGETREQIASALVREFALDAASAAKDVEAALAGFAQSDLFAQ